MKQFFKISLVMLTAVLAFAACNKLKVDPLPHYDNGNAVSLTSSASAITPSAADSNNVVVSFSWTNPNYATDSANYKFVLEIDSAGRNFSQSTTRIIMAGYSTDITGRQLNNILLNYGFTIGQPYNLEARIASSYGNSNERYYSNSVSLSVSAFTDPSILTSSVSSVVLTLPNAALDAVTFNWSPSFIGYSGAVTYTLQFDIAGGNFATPNDVPVGNGIYTATYTQDQVNTAAAIAGIVPGALGTVEYRMKAVTAQGAVAYSNTINLEIQSYISVLRFYMPGDYQIAEGYGPSNWEPATAPEMIRDQRPGLLNSMYYIYIHLPANAQFKFTQGQNWNTNYGPNGPGTLELGNPNNVTVTAAGYYRITINVATLEYNVMEGRMGFVGGATGAGWSPPDVFPNYAMGNAATNLFVGLTDLTLDAWKLIDNNAWNSGSNSVDETRSYGTSLPSGSSLEVNGSNNFSNPPAAGRYRVIWDGRDRDNVKYEMYPGDEMRIVGNGLTGVPDWDPAGSPTMTYSGNGVWTITLGLDANESFKFLGGNAWGAFDYEDQSGGSQALATPRPISWNSGGGDFRTPATAGSYTVTLNENNQTVTVN